MAGGGQGAGVPQGGQTSLSENPGVQGVAMQQMPGTGGNLQSVYNAKLASGLLEPSGQTSQQFTSSSNPMGPQGDGGTAGVYRGYADGGMTQTPYNNFASPNQNFMTYQGQGQLNQPPQLTQTQYSGGPDAGADYAPANIGFDNSGSDGGVGGAPAPMQTPLGAAPSGMTSGLPQAQGNKPLGLAQFQQPQGLQIQGNPSSQVVQRPQQR